MNPSQADAPVPHPLAGILKTLGPGILFAGAAIGGSHLVQSTRAGASYGFTLVAIVILANLFKYPFFEFSHRYTAATGKSLIEGYRDIGRWALAAFFVLAILAAVMNAAGVTLVAAGLLGLLTGSSWSAFTLSIVILATCGLILLVGRYAALDWVMKLMVAVLGACTLFAVAVAAAHGMAAPDAVAPTVWDLAGFSFLIALMGWMPAPIDVSVWPSLWALERRKQTGHRPSLKEALVDFHIGYILTAVLALAFVALGALVMFGTGETFSNSGVAFSGQVVDMYVRTLGGWTRLIISVVAFFTMFSTTLTVMDGYTRTLRGSIDLLWPKRAINPARAYWTIMAILFVFALVIIGQFMDTMKSLIDLATILAFLAAPPLAYLNWRAVMSPEVPPEARPPKWLRVLSWAGIAFLLAFSAIYLVWRVME
jgi:Mn2+/Fe2+ NRAMP family transporter